VRFEPRLKLLNPEPAPNKKALGTDDVLLVTGGGKGIAAESALQLARSYGCTLALMGRSSANSDEELRKNLARIAEAGVSFSYFAADVTDCSEVEKALRKIQTELGPITAVLHGAGNNYPQRLEEIAEEDLRQMLAPKVTGLRNLLNNIVPANLRLLIAFGSII